LRGSLAIDIVRVVCAHLIVWHHFTIYGPFAASVRPFAPALFDGLEGQARMVVQVFLVFGGCFAARALWPGAGSSDRASTVGLRQHRPWRAMVGRWWRLMPPLWAALALVLVATALGQAWGLGSADGLPSWPTLGQFVANALLLQDVLGVPSMSAGLWYVAIDFQLYACLALLAWALGQRWGQRMPIVLGVVTVAVVASAFVFNRDADRFDAYAPYFMASYGLGALAWWVSARVPGARVAFALAALAVVTALVIDPRERLTLALASAVVLVALLNFAPRATAPRGAWWAADTYVLFLVHYPVLLIVTAVWLRFVPASPTSHAVALLVAWLTSMALASSKLFRR
jgi:peptidoglycan/LPS O-acetylase OafA/YrhL